MNKIRYINPEFKAMVEMIPADVSRELDLSFDIANRIEKILERKKAMLGASAAKLASRFCKSCRQKGGRNQQVDERTAQFHH